MEIIAHRGFWKEANEKNSEQAFIRSAQNNFGIETDVRDFNGDLVIAHDVPQAGRGLMSFGKFLQLYYKHSDPGYLAINVKADGLQQMLLKLLEENRANRYFVFDMSIPDTIGYKNLQMPFYSRLSEYEQQLAFETDCEGVWLDAFESIWYTTDLVKGLLDNGKKVCIVSPELHKRDHQPLWNDLKKAGLHLYKEVLLCTDFPDQALTFFTKPHD
jgi:glycerophosphoryl diester phosphodiesterase